MKHYLIAPAGTPIVFGELVRTLTDRLKRSSQYEALSERIRRFTGLPHSYFFNSGRAAQAVLLQSMRELREGCSEVVLPAYTCYSVAASAVRAGLKIRIIDVDPESFDFDYSALERAGGAPIAAVVGCNLFGVLNDWPRLQALSKSHGYFLVDDGAQSFGVRENGRASGTFGSAGFYSLGRGKALTTYSGGILVTDNEVLNQKLADKFAAIPTVGVAEEITSYLKMALYAAFIRPNLYWIPASLPFLGIGETIYEEDFKIGRLSRVQVTAGSVIFENVLYFHRMRAANAQHLARLVLELEQFKVPGWHDIKTPAYLRLPVLAPNREARERAITELRRRRIVATRMYPSTLRQIPGIENHLATLDSDFPGAQLLVDRLFTLPTHPYLADQDFDNIIAGLKAV